jgi:hypothetical protein|tara:strand:+ start:162 stop:413 length:252 start_codon:yes stop_codon:yes gene_type:complete
MTKDLTNIIQKNIQYLKSSLGITEAHITWGDRRIKEKYSKIKQRLQLKMKEQLIDKKTLNDSYEEEVKGSLEFNIRCKEILGI